LEAVDDYSTTSQPTKKLSTSRRPLTRNPISKKPKTETRNNTQFVEGVKVKVTVKFTL